MNNSLLGLWLGILNDMEREGAVRLIDTGDMKSNLSD